MGLEHIVRKSFADQRGNLPIYLEILLLLLLTQNTIQTFDYLLISATLERDRFPLVVEP
jgi:hypothetical protein